MGGRYPFAFPRILTRSPPSAAQFETASCLGARQRTFVEENKIEAVLINEVSPVLLQSPWGPRSDPSRLPGMIQAVTSTDAYYYLCFVMKSGDDMALAFPVRSPPPASSSAAVLRKVLTAHSLLNPYRRLQGRGWTSSRRLTTRPRPCSKRSAECRCYLLEQCRQR